jgi:antagonist of KipI
MAEAQTVGGYARLGHVISADLPRLAQLRPGEALHFLPVTMLEAQRLQRARSASLARMALAIEARMAALFTR